MNCRKLFEVSKCAKIELATDNELEAQKTIEAYKAAMVPSFGLRNNSSRSITVYWLPKGETVYRTRTVQIKSLQEEQ